jgi:hypothetical protein
MICYARAASATCGVALLIALEPAEEGMAEITPQIVDRFPRSLLLDDFIDQSVARAARRAVRARELRSRIGQRSR